MKKIACKMNGKKGYLVLDDNKNYVGRIWDLGADNQKFRWMWQHANHPMFVFCRSLKTAIEEIENSKL
jgi:hypothetical protein